MTDERDLLAAARRGLSPTATDQDRVRRATAAALAAGGAAPTGAAGPGAARATHWASRLIVVGVVAAAAAGIGYRAGLRAGREQATVERSYPTAPVAAAPRPAAANEPVAAQPSAPPAPLPSPAGAPRSRPGIPHRVAADPVPAPVVPTASLAEEVRALRSVERALRDRNPGFALALLRELDRAVPNGQLVEERLATRTIARCASGDVPMGVDLADDFAEHYPDSVYGRRVVEACSGTDSARSGHTKARRPPHDDN